jgi:hypothetical protein
MSYTEKHLDQVDSYLSRPGRNGGGPPHLSPEGQTDPPLKEAIRDVELLWQATRLEKLQEKLEMLREYEQELQAKASSTAPGMSGAKAEEERSGKIVSLSRRKWILSAAAGVAMLVVAGWLVFRDQGPQTIQHEYLAMNFEDQYVLHDVMKSDGASKYSPEQLRAYDLYAVKDFKSAIPLLKAEWVVNGDTLALFYLWVSYIAIGDRNSSLQYQEEINMLAAQSPGIKNLVERLNQ